MTLSLGQGVGAVLDEAGLVVLDQGDDGEVDRLLVQLQQQRDDHADGHGGGDGQQQRGDERGDEAICEFGPVRRIVITSPGAANRPRRRSGGRERGHRHLAHHAGEGDQDHQHPEPARIDAQRVRAPASVFSAVWPTDPPTGCPRRTRTRCCRALGDEILVGLGRAVAVRRRLGDTGALHEDDRRDRHRTGDGDSENRPRSGS